MGRCSTSPSFLSLSFAFEFALASALPIASTKALAASPSAILTLGMCLISLVVIGWESSRKLTRGMSLSRSFALVVGIAAVVGFPLVSSS